MKHTGRPNKTRTVLLHLLFFILETLLLAAIGLHLVLLHVTHGVSPAAARLFARSVRETSAVGFLADWYCGPEEPETLAEPGRVFVKTDTALIDETAPAPDESGADAWGLVDEDGDGIILCEVKGEGYAGYMMVVLDRTRVVLATDPASYGRKGHTVEEFARLHGAVAGINGGAFLDPNGEGDGSYPLGLVVYEDQIFNDDVRQGFAGIDGNGILHVGCTCAADAVAEGIRYGASYGPVLVQNGEMTPYDTLESGVNPRTAIGQRADGAFLLLVIDGRQVLSLGATYLDEAKIMLEYGAVNAVNMDGGSSSMMWYRDGYVNNSASVIGVRPNPTVWLVLPQKGGGKS